MTDVIVLGAGPAGLMAALDLVRAGHRCRVLEASDRVGGMAGSFEIAGITVDHGSHRFHPAAPPRIRAVVEELLEGDLQRRPRNGRLRLADRWVGFPLRTGQLLRTLPPPVTLRLATEAVATTLAGLRPRPEPESFAQAVAARMGPTVAATFYGPYARKLYGCEPDDLDPELARRRVAVGSPVDIARRLVRARRPDGRQFLYPRRGYGQIVDRLAEAATEAGASIELGQAVERVVTVEDGGVRVTTTDGSWEGAVALSTLPIAVLARALEPRPPTEVVAAIARRPTRAMLLVYLVVPRPQYTGHDAHYIPGPETPVARLSEPKNYRDGDDPGDHTVLCAEIPCWPGDHRSTTADDLGALVVDGLARVGLPPVEVVEVVVRRLPSVYPVYDRAGARDRAIIDRWLADLGPVLSLGRQGLGVIDNLHHVLAMGSAAASVVAADGSIRIDRWRDHLAGFADHTVED